MQQIKQNKFNEREVSSIENVMYYQKKAQKSPYRKRHPFHSTDSWISLKRQPWNIKNNRDGESDALFRYGFSPTGSWKTSKRILQRPGIGKLKEGGQAHGQHSLKAAAD